MNFFHLSIFIRIGLLASFLYSEIPALAGAAHVHGEAKVHVVKNSDHELMIELQAPAIDIFGFEKEKKIKDRASEFKSKISDLYQGSRHIVLEPSLSCSIKVDELKAFGQIWDQDGKVLKEDRKSASANVNHSHQHEKESQHKEEHSDVSLKYTTQCKKPIKGQTISIQFSQNFPALKKIEVIYLSDQQQKWSSRKPVFQFKL